MDWDVYGRMISAPTAGPDVSVSNVGATLVVARGEARTKDGSARDVCGRMISAPTARPGVSDSIVGVGVPDDP